MIRRLIPLSVLPLVLLATGLASAPWLRAFPADVMAAPLFGAAVLSVLVPVTSARLLSARLWLTALVDLFCFVVYTLLAVLKDPAGINDLVDGLVHGPAQLLTFALPLVSPPTLLVAPVALCWLAGAVAGECVARGWVSVLPFFGWLVAFGLSYAATVRAGTSGTHGTRVADTWLAVALLATLLLLRAAQSWLRQDASAESTQPDGVLPLRGLFVGLAATVAVTLLAAAAVQSAAFEGRTRAPQRVPAVDQSRPLSPVAYVAGLRPSTPTAAGDPVFRVTVDSPSSPYFGIANVDYYDGDGWTFDRSFRPSGGILPADRDPALSISRPPTVQHYRIERGPLTSAPWMPFQYRPEKVTGAGVNIDAESGMIVPTEPLRAGASYTVRSDAPTVDLGSLPPTSLPATSAPPIDTQLPGSLRVTLGKLADALATETGVPTSPALPFLQALAKDLQRNYALAGGPPKARTSTAAPTTPKAGPTKRGAKSTTARPTPTPAVSASTRPRVGGVSFADVMASVIGTDRAATPEQYATLFALVARQLGVPARLASGFRVPANGGATLRPGTYTVTTANAWTWVEIPVRGAGWVVVDPAPSSYSGAQQQSVGAEPSQTPSATPTQNALITKANGGHAVAPKSVVPHRRAGSKSGLLVAVPLVLGALAVLVLAAMIWRKRRRIRRRRRAADPRGRLLGAWHESLDMLSESGLPDLAHLTSTEVAAATSTRFGGEPAAEAHFLGQAANTAVYRPSSPVAPADADAAWRSELNLRRLVRRRLSMRARLAAGVRFHRATAPERQVAGPASWAETAHGKGAAPSPRQRLIRRRGRHTR